MALEPITRQEQIIAGKDLEPITRMEKFLKKYRGVSSWNDLTDKPFGVEQAFEPIEFDGYIGGFPDESEYIDIKPILGDLVGSYEVILLKVSTPTAPASSYDGAVVVCTHPSVNEHPTTECILQPMPGSSDTARLYPLSIYQYDENYDEWSTFCEGWVSVVTGENEFGIPVGVYVHAAGTGTLGYYPGKIFKEIVKPIDQKYLPEPLLTSPGGKKFKLTVDDSGVLSATEV